MDIKGEYKIPARREEVWEALNDPDILKVCMPGCEELIKISDTEFTAKVTAKVGAVKAKFKGDVTLSDIDAPNSYIITGQGQGGIAGFAKGSARVILVPEGTDTILRYDAKADIGGKLAAVGGRVIQGVAKKTADDFFSAFVEHFGGMGYLSPPEEPEKRSSSGFAAWLWFLAATGIIAILTAYLI